MQVLGKLKAFFKSFLVRNRINSVELELSGIKNTVSTIVGQIPDEVTVRTKLIRQNIDELRTRVGSVQDLFVEFNSGISNKLKKELENEKKARNEQHKRFVEKTKKLLEGFKLELEMEYEARKRLTMSSDEEFQDFKKNCLDKLEKNLRFFNEIDEIKRRVSVDYDKYLQELRAEYTTLLGYLEEVVNEYKKEISKFKKNDNAVVRLSSLETRITLLEESLKKSPIKLHVLEKSE